MAHAAKQHERQFGWKTFRVLTVTTDHHRMQSMMEALRNFTSRTAPALPSSSSRPVTSCALPIRLRMSGRMATAAQSD